LITLGYPVILNSTRPNKLKTAYGYSVSIFSMAVKIFNKSILDSVGIPNVWKELTLGQIWNEPVFLSKYPIFFV